MQFYKRTGSMHLYHVHSALLTSSEQGIVKASQLPKRLAPFSLNMTLLQRILAVDELAVRASYLS